MDTLHQCLLYSHILAGAAALGSGLLAMLARKAPGLHVWAGRAFYYGMMWVCASALLSIVCFRFVPFLLVIAAFTFHLTFSGRRVLYRKRPGQVSWIDWAGAIVTLVAGVGIMGYGGWLIATLPEFQPLMVLCFVFGLGLCHFARTDMRTFRDEQLTDQMWWLYHHMTCMVGAYIAAVTAFAVFGAGRLLADLPFAWLAWILPGVVGGILNRRWVQSYRRKFNSASTSR